MCWGESIRAASVRNNRESRATRLRGGKILIINVPLTREFVRSEFDESWRQQLLSSRTVLFLFCSVFVFFLSSHATFRSYLSFCFSPQPEISTALNSSHHASRPIHNQEPNIRVFSLSQKNYRPFRTCSVRVRKRAVVVKFLGACFGYGDRL